MRPRDVCGRLGPGFSGMTLSLWLWLLLLYVSRMNSHHAAWVAGGWASARDTISTGDLPYLLPLKTSREEETEGGREKRREVIPVMHGEIQRRSCTSDTGILRCIPSRTLPIQIDTQVCPG